MSPQQRLSARLDPEHVHRPVLMAGQRDRLRIKQVRGAGVRLWLVEPVRRELSLRTMRRGPVSRAYFPTWSLAVRAACEYLSSTKGRMPG